MPAGSAAPPTRLPRRTAAIRRYLQLALYGAVTVLLGGLVVWARPAVLCYARLAGVVTAIQDPVNGSDSTTGGRSGSQVAAARTVRATRAGPPGRSPRTRPGRRHQLTAPSRSTGHTSVAQAASPSTLAGGRQR